MEQQHEAAKHAADIAAGGVALGTLAGWLPTIAALLSIIWMLIRLFEWVEKRIADRRKKAR